MLLEIEPNDIRKRQFYSLEDFLHFIFGKESWFSEKELDLIGSRIIDILQKRGCADSVSREFIIYWNKREHYYVKDIVKILCPEDINIVGFARSPERAIKDILALLPFRLFYCYYFVTSEGKARFVVAEVYTGEPLLEKIREEVEI